MEGEGVMESEGERGVGSGTGGELWGVMGGGEQWREWGGMEGGGMMGGEGGGMMEGEGGRGMVWWEGGRGSTGAHSPGLVVAFIHCRPWGVVVSEGARRSCGIVSSGGGASSACA